VPRVTLQNNNFTAGEISPRLVGRTDIDRYGNAARLLVNVVPVIHGGAKRRGGTRYVAATKTSSVKSRNVPFVFSRDQAYMLIFGDLNMRIYAAGGGALLAEVVTPYTAAMLPDIDYVQGADTMFISHPTVPIQRLRRFSNSAWDLSAAPFVTTPFDEQGHALAANLTLSAATVGAARTATASASVFLPSDVGRQLAGGAGLGTVVGYTSGTVITIDITIAFAGTALASGAWYLDVSPQSMVKPSAKDPAGTTITLIGARSRAADVTLSAKTVGAARTITASAAVFTAGDVGNNFYADSGIANIVGFTSATVITVDISADFVSTTYSAGAWGISVPTWRTEDIGKFVRINGGLAKIVSLISSNAASATLIAALTSTVVSPALAWSLEAAVWSAANGYPRTVSFHEQRLIAAGSTKFPQTIWGSRIGEYLDFTKGTNDDDSYSFTIASDEINPISYVASLRNLVVHTYGGEFSLRGGIEKPITPTNVQIKPESPYGSKGVRPVLIGKESVFVQRAGRKVRALSYDYSGDGYRSPDLAVLAEHITLGGITGLAYQQEPDLLLWATRADGAMLSCTLDRDQSVIGWAKHYTDGAFESVATIPNGDREETWVIVRRSVNGATVRYIEIIDETFAPMLPGAVNANAFPPVAQPVVFGSTADCAVSFDNASGQTVFSVPHLIGKKVDILADGAVMPAQVVPVSGNVTLTRLSYRTLIGLHFRSEIGLLTPEVGTATGTAQGNSMRTSELTLRFLETIGAKVVNQDGREQTVPFRSFGPDVLDQAPLAYTGELRVEVLGWERGKSELSVVQDQPLPLHLLAAIRKFTVNEG
jgi:hypothetical protein